MFTTGMSLFLTSFLYCLSLHLTFYSFDSPSPCKQIPNSVCLTSLLSPSCLLHLQLRTLWWKLNSLLQPNPPESVPPSDFPVSLHSTDFIPAAVGLKASWLLVLFTPTSDHWPDASVHFSVSHASVPLSFPFRSHYDLHPAGVSFFLELLYCL